MTIGVYEQPRSFGTTRNTSGGLTIVTEPAVEPIVTADAKLFARIESSVTTDDVLIDALIEAARRDVEAYTGRALMTQTWDWFLDDEPGSILEVPLPPLASVTEIAFTDSDGTEAAAVSSSLYTVDTTRNRILLNDGESWGYTDLRSFRGTRVRFVAGYGATAADVSDTTPPVASCPADILTSIRRMVLEAYEGRGPDMPTDVRRMLHRYKQVRV